jgi:para-aminobenzoate synthetase component 1
MIVDLLRNDLSRVCAPGSVRVPVLCGLESYASVHHLTSVVTGVLKPDKTVGDLIAAVFPGGSITGAPKIRAMEVMQRSRGGARIYCGSIGYFGFNGQVDLSIAIRTAMFSQGTARFKGRWYHGPLRRRRNTKKHSPRSAASWRPLRHDPDSR